MKLWRLVHEPFVALDGSGPERHGARYSSPGKPVVNFASEAGLAVFVALRYLPENSDEWPEDFVLGWTDMDASPEAVPVLPDEAEIAAWVDTWLNSERSLLASIPSKVLSEGDIVMFNPKHRDAAGVPPLVTRRFNFKECLHRPPMLDAYRSQQ